MPAPYSAKAVANFFLTRRPHRLTQMQLHKIIYYAHGWHLAIKGLEHPLLNEMVEAWEYGPVIPSLYHEFKEFGARPIPRPATDWNPATEEYDITPSVDSDDRSVLVILAKVDQVYGHRSAAALSAATHVPDSPWTKTREKYPWAVNADIPNDLIHSYFVAQATRNAST